MIKKHKYPLYVFYWTDAASGDGWEDTTDIKEARVETDVTTIGFLIDEDELLYYTASTYTERSDGKVSNNCRMAIPKKWCKKKKIT